MKRHGLGMVLAGFAAFATFAAGCGGGGGGGGAGSRVAPPIALATASLPDGTVGTAYQAALGVTGGVDPISWRVASGTLPPGLTLTPAQGRNIALQGTPNAANATPGYTFTLEAKDANQSASLKQYTVKIIDALAIPTASLPDGETYEPYSAPIQAIGGQAPYAWSVSGSPLPAGISLSPVTGANVAIQGTTSANGTFNFTVNVQDSAGRTASKPLSVRFDDIERYVYGGRIDNLSTEQVYVTERVNGAPTTPRRLVSHSNQGSFAQKFPLYVSPDQKYAAAIMDRDRAQAFDIQLIDLKGPNANRVRLANEPFAKIQGQEVKRAFFSPDSRWIAFVGDVSAAGATANDLFVADVTVPGTMTAINLTQCTTNLRFSFWDAAFTADGRYLVWICDTDPLPGNGGGGPGETMELFYADLHAASPAKVRLNQTLADAATMDISGFTVSPVGSAVAYRGDLVNDGVQDAFYVTLSGGVAGATKRVSDATSRHAQHSGPSISPTGNRLVFTAGNSPTQALDHFNSPVPGHLAYVVDLQPASPAPVALAGTTGAVNGESIRWTPDGARVLLYRQDDNGSGVVAAGGELVLINAATLASTRVNVTTWDADTKIAFRGSGMAGRFFDQYSIGFSPDGTKVFYKQETAAGTVLGGQAFAVELFVRGISAGALGPVIQSSPSIAGLNSGGVWEEVAFSADSTKIYMGFVDAAAKIKIYVHDLTLNPPVLAATSISGRLNNNAPGPKWTPGDRGLVLSGPLDAASPAYNELFFLDLVGGVQKLTPPLPTQGDQTDFFPND